MTKFCFPTLRKRFPHTRVCYRTHTHTAETISDATHTDKLGRCRIVGARARARGGRGEVQRPGWWRRRRRWPRVVHGRHPRGARSLRTPPATRRSHGVSEARLLAPRRRRSGAARARPARAPRIPERRRIGLRRAHGGCGDGPVLGCLRPRARRAARGLSRPLCARRPHRLLTAASLRRGAEAAGIARGLAHAHRRCGGRVCAPQEARGSTRG